MNIEIEKKYLVNQERWNTVKEDLNFQLIRQAYLFKDSLKSMRVRIIGDHSNICLKSKIDDCQRNEFEYDIPLQDAKEIMKLSKHQVHKKRYSYSFDGFLWEIDEFLSDNQGLILAEIELDSIEQSFSKPDFITQEVSSDKRYLNEELAETPYSTWNQ